MANEAVARCLICGRGPKEHDSGTGLLTCRSIAVPTYRPARTTPNLATAVEDERTSAAAIDQNDAMRQELAHVGNLISDLARTMRVDQANADGSWPDLAGRVQKLIKAERTRPPTLPDDRDAVIAGMREALEEVRECMLRGGDGQIRDYGWNISRLTKARPMILAALSKHDRNEGEDDGE